MLAGAGALGYAFTRKAEGGMTAQQTAAMTTAMGEVDAEIAKARSTLRGGAEALAKLVPVQVAVVTDEVTARDAVEKGELNFSPDPGVVIELGQIISDKHMPLVVQPAGAKPFVTAATGSGKVGSFAMLNQFDLTIMEVVGVTPRSDAVRDGQPITGYIAASRVIDMVPAINKLKDAGINGYLRGANKESVPIGAPAENAKRAEYRPPSQNGFGVTGQGAPFDIVADLPAAKAAMPMPIVGAGAG